MDGSCLTTKELGCTGLFSPSGLSAAPGSNIHLAWCIPGLETLMWFVGESRWQVHGSTLLTDSAGASGRVHNNTKWLSPPSFFRQSKHASYPQPYHHHTHTRVFLFLISICWHQEITQGNCRDADIQLYQPCDLLFSTPFSSQCLSLLFPCLSLSLSLYPLLHLCTHLFCLTSLHSLLLPQRSCTCPLTRPPPSFAFHSLHQSLSSFLFLHLFCSPSTFSHRARTQLLEIWCLVLPLQCRNDVMQ